MRCAIIQPSYIPWRGYFHQIRLADAFVFLDDVQYDTRGWRNRNRIKTQRGPRWLTIPVHGRGAQVLGTPIRAVRIDQSRDWGRKHWRALQHSYGKAPHFEALAPLLEPFYRRTNPYLADFTSELTIALARALGITHTRFVRSSSLDSGTGKTERLIRILTKLGARHYITGPTARDYLDEQRFREHGIRLTYMTYDYDPYPQLYPPYDPRVSVLDLLFMTGPDAIHYLTSSVDREIEP